MGTCNGINKGIIVSIQSYHYKTIAELALESINAGCVGLRIDKHIEIGHRDRKEIAVIGLRKVAVSNIREEPYITPDIDTIESVRPWCDYVAIDFRMCNKNLKAISEYCKEKKIKVIADIETISDYQSLRDKGLYYTYIATTLSVYSILFRPDLKLLEQLVEAGEKNIIAEGNFNARHDVKDAFDIGATAVCIGGAISNVYKLTRKYVSILSQNGGQSE